MFVNIELALIYFCHCIRMFSLVLAMAYLQILLLKYDTVDYHAMRPWHSGDDFRQWITISEVRIQFLPFLFLNFFFFFFFCFVLFLPFLLFLMQRMKLLNFSLIIVNDFLLFSQIFA